MERIKAGTETGTENRRFLFFAEGTSENFRGDIMLKKIIKSRHSLYVAAVILAAAAFPAAFPARVQAAFPYNMDEKPVIAESVSSDNVTIFRDGACKEYKKVVSGENFKITISKSRGDALFGSWENGEKQGTGWINKKVVILHPDQKNVYATVRTPMNIYTNSSCEKKQDRIKKYSGVILVSKKGDARQVIYSEKDHYGIGWMKREDYKNSLKYDGREKRTLADGTYTFRCGYLDNKDGGMDEQPETDSYKTYELAISFLTKNEYLLSDIQTGRYLHAVPDWKEGTFSLEWADQPDEVFGRFKAERQTGSFTFTNTISGGLLGQSREGEMILTTDGSTESTRWRVLAKDRICDLEKPFVFTQYDPAWCRKSYGSEGCMGTAGCGILATVNAVYSLTGQYMDVMELADYAVDKHYRIIGSGTDEGIFKAACKKYGKKYGFEWDGSSKKIKTLKKKLKEGKTAAVHVPGHYVCISAYNEKTKKYLLLDSNYLPKRKDSPYGDWISESRLREGTLESQGFFFFKRRDR